jgi:TadE-like protein
MLQLVECARVMLGLRNATDKVALFKADRRGVAAIEFAFFGGLLSLAILNVADISIYIYQRMEVENATEMAAQIALKCATTQLPATENGNCPNLIANVQAAMQSTSLGTGVTLQSNSPSEWWYCVNSSNQIGQNPVPITSTKPIDCSNWGMPSLQPGDYIKIDTTFTYKPLFPGITVASAFRTPITTTAHMRLQ